MTSKKRGERVLTPRHASRRNDQAAPHVYRARISGTESGETRL